MSAVEALVRINYLARHVIPVCNHPILESCNTSIAAALRDSYCGFLTYCVSTKTEGVNSEVLL